MESVHINPRWLTCWIIASSGLLLFVVFASDHERAVLGRTLGLGIGAATIAIPLGSCLAWVSLGRGFVSRVTSWATLMLLIVPVFLHVSTWDAAFGRLGWLTSTEGQVLMPLVSGWTAAVWIHGIAAAPQVAILILVGLSSGRRTFEEQALLDASRFEVFFYITLHRLWPIFVLSALWTIVVCSREIAATDLYQVGTLAEQIYLGYSLGQINSWAGNWTAEDLAAAGRLDPRLTLVFVFWLATTAGWVFVRLTRQEMNSEGRLPRQTHFFASQLDRSGWRRSSVGIFLLLVLVAIPLGNLVARCCYFVRPVDGIPVAGYSVVQFSATIRRACFDYTTEFFWSTAIAVTSATVILVLALGLSWLARKYRGWQVLLLGTLAVSCALPGPAIGTFLMRLFSAFDVSLINWLFDRTILAPVLANTVFCWPLAPLIVWYLFRSVPADALEHAQLDGAGEFSQFLRFGIMSNWVALSGCWLILLAFCFGELSASQLVLPPGIDTIPRLMLGLLHAGVDEMTAALTLVSLGMIGVVSAIGWGLIALHGHRRSLSLSLVPGGSE